GEGVVHCRPCAITNGDVAFGFSHGRRFEHWGVNNPYKGPVLFFCCYFGVAFNETCAVADFNSCCTKQCPRRCWVTGGEEDRVARARIDFCVQSSLFCFGDVFGDRSSQFAVFLVQDVGQTVCAALFGPFLPGVELPAWLGATTGHDHGTDVVVLEDPEWCVLEVFGHI